jgi:hypothetical protein
MEDSFKKGWKFALRRNERSPAVGGKQESTPAPEARGKKTKLLHFHPTEDV